MRRPPSRGHTGGLVSPLADAGVPHSSHPLSPSLPRVGERHCLGTAPVTNPSGLPYAHRLLPQAWPRTLHGLTSGVSLGKSLPVSEPQFPHSRRGAQRPRAEQRTVTGSTRPPGPTARPPGGEGGRGGGAKTGRGHCGAWPRGRGQTGGAHWLSRRRRRGRGRGWGEGRGEGQWRRSRRRRGGARVVVG